MKKIKEFFGNIPIFQRQVEREINGKNIEPTDGIKKVEHGRQVTRRLIISLLVIVLIVLAILFYFNNKNGPTPPISNATTNSESSTKQTEQNTQDSQATSNSTLEAGTADNDHLLKLSAKERAKEATDAFKTWYESFDTKQPVLEINEELLTTDAGGTSPIELQTKLIDNLKASFGDQVAPDFYTSLQQAFNFNPVVVDSEKGLTISKQNEDKAQWLKTWFLDTESTEKNTKIILRNDFTYEYFDWRNEASKDEKTKDLLSEIDWDNDISYETVGVSLMHLTKNIESPEIVFIVMHYDDQYGWQVSGSIGGITE